MKILYALIGACAAALLIYCGVFFYAWHSNAVAGTKYNITELNNFFSIVAAQATALVANQSIFNTNIPWLNGILEKLKGGKPNDNEPH